MVAILIMSAKLTTLVLLEIKIFQSKDYDAIIYVHDVTRKSLSNKVNQIMF